MLAHTVIGKGVSFMEDQPEFHGRGLTAEEYPRAMAELGLDPARARAARGARRAEPCTRRRARAPDAGGRGRRRAQPRTLRGGREDRQPRRAWGTALVDLADGQPGRPDRRARLRPGASRSRPTGSRRRGPRASSQCGVGEHNAATAGGALSTVPGVLSFWATSASFGIDEVYNQQRLNDINGAALKLALTHCGLDVGEDGKTHQCIDYVGALRDFFGWKVIVPADPNQTDRAVRAAAAHAGQRRDRDGPQQAAGAFSTTTATPLFGGRLRVRATARSSGRARARTPCVLTMGTLAGAAVAAADLLCARRASRSRWGSSPARCDLDDAAMRYAAEAPLLVTVEDHSARTGLGASVAEWLADARLRARGSSRSACDGYQSSGASRELFARAGLDAEGIARPHRAERASAR